MPMPRWAFILWLVTALTARLWAAWREPAYLHPDALGQGLEPAFRAVFGHGDVAWEWQQGLRSWSWPGLLAPAFAAGAATGTPEPGVGMAPWLFAARMMPLALDMISGGLAIRLAGRLAGPESGGASIAAGLVAVLTALHPAWVEMAGQPLIDVPAATALLALLALLETGPSGPGRSIAAGALASLVLMVRIQLLPGVLVALLLHGGGLARRLGRAPLEPRSLAVGAAAGLAPFALLDLWTWGAPFASTVAYLRFNAAGGQAVFGTMPADRYAEHLQLALPVVWPALVALALVGATRAPVLGAVFVVTVASHQLVPMRIWRALHPALWLLPVLAGIGGSWLAARLRDRGRPRRPWLALGLALCLASTWVAVRDETLWRTTWLWNQGGAEAVDLSRALNRAALAVSAGPPVRTVLQAVLPAAAAPGHALFGHDVTLLQPLGASPGLDPRAVREADVWIVRDGAIPAAMRDGRDCAGPFAPDVLVCWRRPALAAPRPGTRIPP